MVCKSCLTVSKNLLTISPLVFYHYEDEELFFGWLNKIKCIKSYEGIGRVLYAKLNPQMQKNISYEDFVNLYGLFKRYNLRGIDQLKNIFMNDKNKAWFEPRKIKKKAI